MKVVVACAGKGTRLYPITLTTPKPLISIWGNSPLSTIIEATKDIADEIIIVANSGNEHLFREIAASCPIRVIVQGDISGTASALLSAKGLVSGDFLFVNGDDIYAKEIIDQAAKTPFSMVGKYVDDPSKYGVIHTQDGHVKEIIEKPKEYVGSFVNIGIYHISEDIFDIIEHMELSERGEYEITAAINAYVQQHEITCIETTDAWLPIGYPWHILEAMDVLSKHMPTDIRGTVGDDVVIDGEVYLGEGSVINRNVRVHGNVYIGKNCIIESGVTIEGPVQISDGSYIGLDSRLSRTYIGKNTTIFSKASIGNAVIMNHVTMHEQAVSTMGSEKTVVVEINGDTIDSNTPDLGVIIADHVIIEESASFAPGVMIYPHSTVHSGTFVQSNVYSPK